VDGEYQTNDFTLAPSGAPYSVPSTVPYARQSPPQNWSTFSLTATGAGTTLPVATNVASRPGWGIDAMSGGVPASTRTGS